MNRAPFHCRAKWIGSEARRLLASPGFSGQILAVVSKTIYLQSSRGEILWVVTGSLPMHRRSLLASFPASLFNPGEGFFTRESKLCIEENKTIAFDQAREWNPKSIIPYEAAPLMVLEERLKRLWTAVQIHVRPEGAMPFLSAMGMNTASTPLPDDRVNFGISGMMDAAEAFLAPDLTQTAQKARSLVGWGWGLTPSGDDFLGGLLFAIHVLENAYPEDFKRDRKAVADLMEWAKERTNPISHTLLSDLALGQGPEPLHELVNAIVMGTDLGNVMFNTNRLMEIGSTSGWEMLAGFMTGMHLIEGRRNNLRQ